MYVHSCGRIKFVYFPISGSTETNFNWYWSKMFICKSKIIGSIGWWTLNTLRYKLKLSEKWMEKKEHVFIEWIYDFACKSSSSSSYHKIREIYKKGKAT